MTDHPDDCSADGPCVQYEYTCARHGRASEAETAVEPAKPAPIERKQTAFDRYVAGECDASRLSGLAAVGCDALPPHMSRHPSTVNHALMVAVATVVLAERQRAERALTRHVVIAGKLALVSVLVSLLVATLRALFTR